MIGLIKLLLRFVWLGLFILGVKKAVEIIQGGIDDIADRMEEGELSGINAALIKVHEALHRRRSQAASGADALGEM